MSEDSPEYKVGVAAHGSCAPSAGSGNPAAAARHDGETLSRDADISPLTPYYQDAFVTLYHGDCFEILPKLPKADLILTDPPWNLDFFKDDDKSWPQYKIWLAAFLWLAAKRSDATWCFQSTKAIPYIADLFVGWGCFASAKNFCQMTPKRIPNAWDIAFFSSSDGYRGNGRNWHIGKNSSAANSDKSHPTSRPLDTVKYILSMLDFRSVIDPFAGSGTTLRAAKDIGMTAIGIEIEEKYCEIAAKRMAQEVLNFAGGDADFGVTDSNISSQAELLDSPNVAISERANQN